MWDLEAKLARRSIWDLTGLEEPSTISSDVTIGILSPDDTAARADGLRDAPMIKLKLGGEHDLDCVHAVRFGCFLDVPLFVDVNWRLDAGTG